MAKKETFTCDACGVEIPAEGPILVIQKSNDAYPDEAWDLCVVCEDKIVTFIHSLGEK
jgi:hypothetical protein